MVRIALFSLTFLFLLPGSLLAQKPDSIPGYSLFGMFDGRTPCQQLARYLNVSKSPDCIKIKWRLILYKDRHGKTTNGVGTYRLGGLVYSRSAPRTGTWRILKGTPSMPDAVVYELQAEGSPSLFLLKADDNILFFLDASWQVMVGNYDFSYTLNRVPPLK